MDKEIQHKIDKCEKLNTLQLAAFFQELPQYWISDYIDVYCEKTEIKEDDLGEDFILKAVGDLRDFVEEESLVISETFTSKHTDKKKLIALIKGIKIEKLLTKI